MNVDAFTQYNQGGIGVAVTNEGYAQLVSVFHYLLRSSDYLSRWWTSRRCQ